jgi:hypothetical protein
MRRPRFIIALFLIISTLLTGCAQQKVIDTELIRTQNKLKDLEVAFKQRENQMIALEQKIADFGNMLQEQTNRLESVAELRKKTENKYPVIIEHAVIKPEQPGKTPFNIHVTLYNGTDAPIKDNVLVFLIEDTQNPRAVSFIEAYEILPFQSKEIIFRNLSLADPAKRVNIIVKLLEDYPQKKGIEGKITWTIIPPLYTP